MKLKRNAVRDDVARKVWAMEHLTTGCMVCGTRWPDFRGLSVHHILNGKHGRSDEPTNLLLVCGPCHSLCESNFARLGCPLPIPLGMALAIRFIREPESVDWERLRILCDQRLPMLLQPHDWIEKEYRKNRPKPFRPFKTREALDAINDWIDTYEVYR